MRKCTQTVFDAWKKGDESRGQASIWTDGESIFSYGTIILQRDAHRLYFNATKYSRTTTTHQNGLRTLLRYDSTKPDVVMDEVPQGVKNVRNPGLRVAILETA